jgi:TonB family protein
MEILSFFARVNLYWIVFYLCYWLLFRNHTFFRANRIYLIGTLLVAFILPLLKLPDLPKESLPATFYSLSEQTDIFVSVKSVDSTTNMLLFFGAVYITVSVFMLFRLLAGILNIFSVIRQGECHEFSHFKLILLPKNLLSGSFSFFKLLFADNRDYHYNFDAILRHELVHIRQWHSIDMLLIEILKVAFWFNPSLWFYKYAIQQNHEFLADEEVQDREIYATFLVSYARDRRAAFLTNTFFNSSMLKTRIAMIYRNRSSKWLLVKYLAIMPITCTFLLITSAKAHVSGVVSQFSVASREVYEHFSTAEKQPEKPEQADESGVVQKLNLGETQIDTILVTPEFAGGKQGLTKYLAENLQYPDIARQVNVEGIVLVSFIVGKDGVPHSPSIIKGVGFGLDKEALRIIDEMPAWKPATKNGKIIEFKYSMEIPFLLKKTAMATEKNRYYSNYIPVQSVQLSPLDLPFLTVKELGVFFKKSFSLEGGQPPKIENKEGKFIPKRQ